MSWAMALERSSPLVKRNQTKLRFLFLGNDSVLVHSYKVVTALPCCYRASPLQNRRDLERVKFSDYFASERQTNKQTHTTHFKGGKQKPQGSNNQTSKMMTTLTISVPSPDAAADEADDADDSLVTDKVSETVAAIQEEDEEVEKDHRTTEQNTDIVKRVVLDRNLRDLMLSYMDLRTLLSFPSMFKGLGRYVTHDLVVQKIVHTAAGKKSSSLPTLKRFQILMSKIERRIIFTPSPMRLLRLMVATTKCEFCLKKKDEILPRYESTFGLSDCRECRASLTTTKTQKNRCTAVRHNSAVSFDTKKWLFDQSFKKGERYKYVHFTEPFFDKFSGEPIGPIITLAVPYEQLQQTYDDAHSGRNLLLQQPEDDHINNNNNKNKNNNKTVNYQAETTLLLARWKKIIEEGVITQTTERGRNI